MGFLILVMSLILQIIWKCMDHSLMKMYGSHFFTRRDIFVAEQFNFSFFLIWLDHRLNPSPKFCCSTSVYSLMWNDIIFLLFLEKLKHKLNLNMSSGFDLKLRLWFISLRHHWSTCNLFLIKLLSFIGVNLMAFMPWSVSVFPDA